VGVVALHRNAELLARVAGPVPALYLMSCAGVLLYLLKVGSRAGGSVADVAKPVAGIHLIVLVFFSPMWVRPAAGLNERAFALCLPLLFHLAIRLAQPGAVRPEDQFARRVGMFVPDRMAPLIAAELKIISLGLFAWGRPVGKEGSFTSCALLRPVLLSLAALASVEVMVMHLLVGRWSHAGAQILTGLGLLTIVYMVGLARSLRHMPSVVAPDRLVVRLGHFHAVDIAYDEITGVSRSAPGEKAPAGSLDLAPMSSPNLVISLCGQKEVVSMAGRVKRFSKVALRLDDVTGFEQALQARRQA
jgi:hypothetical protein